MIKKNGLLFSNKMDIKSSASLLRLEYDMTRTDSRKPLVVHSWRYPGCLPHKTFVKFPSASSYLRQPTFLCILINIYHFKIL